MGFYEKKKLKLILNSYHIQFRKNLVEAHTKHETSNFNLYFYNFFKHVLVLDSVFNPSLNKLVYY
jgi:hypothetical protein